jgi:hypothetical protein
MAAPAVAEATAVAAAGGASVATVAGATAFAEGEVLAIGVLKSTAELIVDACNVITHPLAIGLKA